MDFKQLADKLTSCISELSVKQASLTNLDRELNEKQTLIRKNELKFKQLDEEVKIKLNDIKHKEKELESQNSVSIYRNLSDRIFHYEQEGKVKDETISSLRKIITDLKNKHNKTKNKGAHENKDEREREEEGEEVEEEEEGEEVEEEEEGEEVEEEEEEEGEEVEEEEGEEEVEEEEGEVEEGEEGEEEGEEGEEEEEGEDDDNEYDDFSYKGKSYYKSEKYIYNKNYECIGYLTQKGKLKYY